MPTSFGSDPLRVSYNTKAPAARKPAERRPITRQLEKSTEQRSLLPPLRDASARSTEGAEAAQTPRQPRTMPATSPVNNTQTPGGGWHRGTTNAASELLGAVDGIVQYKDNKTAQKKLKKLEKKPKERRQISTPYPGLRERTRRGRSTWGRPSGFTLSVMRKGMTRSSGRGWAV